MNTTRRPLTAAQSQEIIDRLQSILLQADEMSGLLKTVYGEQDQRAICASEVASSIQRLKWAMERSRDV